MTVDESDAGVGLEVGGSAEAIAGGVAPQPYRDDRDWWRVRRLLVETAPRVMPGWNWDIRRWDGARFHRAQLPTDAELTATIGLWKTTDGRLAGAINPEGHGDAFLQLDPDFRFLEREMIRWAEDRLAWADDGSGGRAGDGSEGSTDAGEGPFVRRLETWVADEDAERCRLLAELGYRPDESGGWSRYLRFDDERVIELLSPGLPAPAREYRVRATDSTEADCARMADLLNAGFDRTVHSAAEIHNFVDLSPSFEHDLNLVAIAPDGSFAATVGATYDSTNRHGLIEPVCTHPNHRRFGLARTLLIEALFRLRERGARTASLDTGEGEAANALYMGCGFVEGHHFRAWRKEL